MPTWLEDRTALVKLDFHHDAGQPGSYFIPQAIGSGAALFDFDNDGRLDLYLLQNGGPHSPSRSRLFHQRPDGSFEDVSAGSGLDINGYNMGVAIGDVNNDGLPDVLVTQYGGIHLFLNKGKGVFQSCGRQAGLDNPLWATSAAFFDYDRDGWLDLVVVNYFNYDPTLKCDNRAGQREYCSPNQFQGRIPRLYHNEGRSAAGPRFKDVTLASGLGQYPGKGLGVVCADLDDDGWPDIFIANDGEVNRLWINRHDGTFSEEAVPRGAAYNGMGQTQANMGIALGDADGDGLLDLFVTHLDHEKHTLWRQGPVGVFHDQTTRAGLDRSAWHGTGWGAVLADFNRDGALDLALVNGGVYRNAVPVEAGLDPFWRCYAQRSQLFAGDGHGQFQDISLHNPAFCGENAVARGLAVGDIDNDGALDLLVTQVAGPTRLFRSCAPHPGHWLLVRAVDPALHRDAYGARITLETSLGRQVGWINPCQSYLCSNDPRAHFGLGSAERVNTMRVRWPDGVEEDFPATAADQIVVLRKGEGRHAGTKRAR